MHHQSILDDKEILAVDDEPDVLEIIKEQLPNCLVATARDFETGIQLIRRKKFDLVILDIMGVNGFELLAECRARHLPATMLTSRAMNEESLNRAIKEGAVSFLPKEELARLPELVAEILEELQRERSHWARLFERLDSFFKEKFGETWSHLDIPPWTGF